MFKTRLQQWDFTKNARSDDWDALAVLHHTRKQRGKHLTEFSVRGKRKTLADLRAHIKAKGKTEEEFYAAALGCEIPDHIRCYTPDPGGTQQQSRSPIHNRPTLTPHVTSSNHPYTPLSPSKSSLTPGPFWVPATPSAVSMTRIQQRAGRQPSRSTMEQEEDFILVPDSSSSPSNSSSMSCDQVQQDVRTMALQVVRPVALMQRYGADDVDSWLLVNKPEDGKSSDEKGRLCPRCRQPRSNHPISVAGLAPSTRQPRNLLTDSDNALKLPSTTEGPGEAWRWMAYCFAACMFSGREDGENATKILEFAKEEFEAMLDKGDCLTLTSLNLMLTMLHQHNQSSIAESVVRSALDVAERVLPPEDLVRTTIQWMVAVAGLKLKPAGENEEALHKLAHIYDTFEIKLGKDNPSTLAALYNYAWMLNFEERYAEAEKLLQNLYERSDLFLGSSHMQTITALSSLSRAQSCQGKYAEAIENIQRAIRDSKPTLGKSHPHRLESKRRLALIYQELGHMELMEELYWDVLKGRIKMLGRDHPYTGGAKRDLIKLLKDLGKWNEDGLSQASIDKLFEVTSPVPSLQAVF